ncbi:MAG: error-prone DNA polymerase [Acidimicrobiaceae bacterium]|nr:error-prone DNA polymerase [Acidimicrobiaceae bacterium]
MGWNSPSVPWKDLEQTLSDRLTTGRVRELWEGDGGDSPAWTRKRSDYTPPAEPVRTRGRVPYAELHCHSNFSFLDGASHPEELAEEAARLGLEALALTDHNGFYGVVRFSEAAKAIGLPTIFGAELTLLAPPGDLADRSASSLTSADLSRPGPPDPHGQHLVILARDPQGYALLARAISEGQLAGEKGAPRIPYERLVELGGTGSGDHWAVLTACRKGPVPAALVNEGPAAARRELERLVSDFGRSNVFVELWDHGMPTDSVRNDGMAGLAVAAGVDIIATANAHHHSVARKRLASAMAAVRARRSLDEIDGWLPPAGMHLRSGEEQAARFTRYPGVVERAATLGLECAFDLSLVAPKLPPYPCPDGLNEMGFLGRLVEEGGARRYGSREAERVEGAWAQLDRELALIDQLGFPGYFLVVWDIVDFCRRSNILCQGRGSAANSAVCFALGITNADAVSLGLLFERFLSSERDGPPDIDIDIESDRREEVIQYVYERHGRHHTAQVANVISYRSKSAIRDMAKALGYAQGQQDAFSTQVDRWRNVSDGMTKAGAVDSDTSIPLQVMELAAEVEHFPRHLGIHSGGMVMCDRPVIEVCPVEWGRMPNRSVLQWDKDDCAAAGLVKFDLLGLGMLSALHYATDFIRDFHGIDIDLAALPQESEVYDMLQKADTIGVFQIESRAQMATLPRLKPRCFYDLVVEVALIRPGPIQGGSVHPYIRRRNGLEPVTYLHPLLENALAKTLGIPLFQEQLMQIAIDVGNFTPADADQLRQAIGSKRSRERMEQLKERFFAGMRDNGIDDELGEQIWLKLAAFANYGFPESHSVSFSYLVYASSWIKHHYPAAFCAALLNAQPMGFWSPHTLVGDARRHGVVVRTPDLNASAASAILEGDSEAEVRLGLEYVRGIGTDLAEEISAGRPYASVEDLRRRMPKLSLPILEALATSGAFGCFGIDRRSALWTAGAMAQTSEDRLAGIVTGIDAPTLPGMSPEELSHADLWATGVAPDGHPTRYIREKLTGIGVITATGLIDQPAGERVFVGGVVTHRQRPATAGGTTFLNLEDETGLINVVISKGCWQRYKGVARGAPALLIRGRLEKEEGVINVVADKLEPLPVGKAPASSDFR